MDPKSLDYSVAYIAGLTSFFSPCLLPLLPSYFTVLTGFTFKELYGLEEKHVRLRMWSSSIIFVIGFSLVYSLLGLTSSAIGAILQDNINLLVRASGAVLVFLGLIQLGVINFEGLQYDYVWNIQKRITNLGYISAFLMGISCALIWIPCVGQILGSILLLASKTSSTYNGFLLLLLYSLGLGTPFIVLGFSFPKIYSLIRQYRQFLIYANRSAGAIMILFGIILILNQYGMVLRLLGL